MLQFVGCCALGLVAALLATTGGAHLLRHRQLVRLLRDHGVLRSALTRVVAVVLIASELTIAATAVVALATGDWRIAAVASAAALVAGLSFVAYLRRLLAVGHRGSCGCTPFDAVLTPASFAPAVALTTVGALGLAATFAGGFDSIVGDAWTALPVAWGLALSGLVILLPATAPQVRPADVSEPLP